jgi:hypothetical protein
MADSNPVADVQHIDPQPAHLRLFGPVTISAEKVIVGNEPAVQPADEQQRVTQNSFLFAVLMLLVTLWFTAHLKTIVTGAILLGTATLWSIFQVIVSRLSEPVDVDALRKRVLARPATVWHLCFFISLLLVLFVGTSSVHVKLGDAKGRVHIRVNEGDGSGVIPSIRLDDDVKIAGAPMLSRFPKRTVVLEVMEPSGYHPLRTVIEPGEPVYLQFPESFNRQTLVRIYAPFKLMPDIPAVGAEKYQDTKLVIEAEGRRAEQAPWAGNAVYVGLSDAATARNLIDKNFNDFSKAQHERLDNLADAQDLAAYIQELRFDPIVRREWDLNEHHTVKATVMIEGKPVMECTAPVLETRINDCLMKEIPQ